MEKIMYVMRGVPGSGKSTAAKIVVPKENIFSTDDFWGPEYAFDISKLGHAHQWNQDRVRTALEQGITPIAVDNTNTTWKEIKPYYEMAQELGYKVIYKESVHPRWLVTAEKLKDKIKFAADIDDDAIFYAKNNSHGVPIETIRKMLNRWKITKELENVKICETNL